MFFKRKSIFSLEDAGLSRENADRYEGSRNRKGELHGYGRCVNPPFAAVVIVNSFHLCILEPHSGFMVMYDNMMTFAKVPMCTGYNTFVPCTRRTSVREACIVPLYICRTAAFVISMMMLWFGFFTS